MSQKKIQFRNNTIFIVILFLFFVFFEYISGIIFPFVFGMAIVFFSRRLAVFLENVSGFNNKESGKIVLSLCYILAVVFFSLIGYFIFINIMSLANISPELISKNVSGFLNTIKKSKILSDSTLNMLVEKAGVYLIDIILGIADKIGEIIMKLPNILLSVFVAVISSYFILNDYDKIRIFIFGQFGRESFCKISKIKNLLSKTVSRMLYSYFVLFLITDIILTVGLYLLGVNNAILLSLVFSVADIFPVLSVGIFIIPWAAFAIFNGKTYLAIGLIALFLIITILRNIIEPKLIGKNIGLHPLMTLASMYIGLRINGLLLSLIMPFIFILVKYLNECGIIFIYKTSKNNNENLL